MTSMASLAYEWISFNIFGHTASVRAINDQQLYIIKDFLS